MTRQILAVCAAAAVLVLAACSAAPTASETAAPTDWQASTAESDSTSSRIPNMMGSGN